MLWNDETAPTLFKELLDEKTAVRDCFVRNVTMLKSFYFGDHVSWMEFVEDNRHLDDREHEFTSYFAKYFKNAWQDGGGSLFPLYLPFINRVTNIRAALFHRAPNLVLVEDETGKGLPSTDDSAKIWKEIQTKGHLNSQNKLWHRMTDLVKTAAMFPNWVQGQIEYEVKTPEELFVKESEYVPYRLDLAHLVMHELPSALSDPTTVLERRFVVWEKPNQYHTEWTVRLTDVFGRDLKDGNGDPVDNPLFANGVNKYKRYPYVLSHAMRPTYGIFAEVDDALLQGQIGLNLAWTDGHLAMRTQWGGQAWKRTGDPSAQPDELVWGRDVVAMLRGDKDGGEDLGHLNYNLDIGGYLSYVDAFMRTYAVMYGLHPDIFSISGDTFSKAITAVAKAVDRIDLQETREDQEAYWELKLQEQFDLSRLVWNTHNKRKIRDDVRLKVEWADPDMAQDPMHEIQSIQAALNSGLMSRAEGVAKLRKIPLEDAKLIVEQIDADKKQAPVEPTRQTPDKIDDESDEV